jgi:hypothetical protein
VQGIYEHLHARTDVRSGRFRFKRILIGPTPQPLAYPHRIIDLRGMGGSARYRLFNAGKVKIKVRSGAAADTTDLAVLSPGDSFDFSVPHSGNRAIFVLALKPDNTPDNTLPIKGIYEFLGE